MKEKIIILWLMLIHILIACSQYDKKKKENTASSDIKIDSIFTNTKKQQLIEFVLNLPGVIRFSKLASIKRKYENIYVILNQQTINEIRSPIIQNGASLNVLSKKDTLDRPYYVFEQIEISGDTANLLMYFDITGLMVSGKLIYVDGQWIPENDLIVGVR